MRARRFRLWRARSGAVALFALALSLFAGAVVAQPQEPRPKYLPVAEEAVRLWGQHDHERAYVKSKEALALAERQLGPRSKAAADMLFNLGRVASGVGKSDEALASYRRAAEIYAAVEGPGHFDVAETLYYLAGTQAGSADLAAAVVTVAQAVAIVEALPERKEKLAEYVFTMAHFQRLLADAAAAEPTFQRALAIHSELYGEGDVRTLGVLSAFGALYHESEQFERALAMHERALALLEQLPDVDPVSTAVPLGNIGAALYALGRLPEAERFMLRSLELRRERLGEGHPDTASMLNNLGNLRRDQGDLEEARKYLERAIATFDQAQPMDPTTAVVHFNLGIILSRLGDLEAAGVHHRRALSIRTQLFGSEHPAIADALVELAYVAHYRGEKDESKRLIAQALAIYEKTAGAADLGVAGALDVRALGEPPRAALETYQRALAIRERVLGQHTQEVGTTLSNLALTTADLGDFRAALGYQAQANAIRERNLTLLLESGSELRKLQALQHVQRELDDTLTIHLRHLPDDDGATRLALTTLLQRKGRELDSTVSALAALRHNLAPEDQRLFDELGAARGALAALLWRASDGKDELARGEKLRARVAELEAAIGERSEAHRAARSVDLADVQAALPADAALVEIGLYQPIRWGHPKARCQPLSYAAYVLAPGAPPRGIELGTTPAIDPLIARFRAALADPSSDPGPAARALDEVVMRPIRALLGERTHVLLSPDGALNLVPFGAMIDEHGHELVERYHFAYLSAGRELARHARSLPARQDAVVFGAPAFGAVAAKATPVADLGDTGAEAAGQRAPAKLALRFPPLPASGAEAELVAGLFPGARTLTGEAATEAAAKELHGPRVLHIATHGFFLPELHTGAANPCSRAAKLVTVAASAAASQPLMQTGLAFAGANSPRGDEDGVLTALEATSLDLAGTKLVVLSACETGVGEVRTGQGVQGLRHALAVAGAETQVMSLWKVDDEATRDLMVGYYQALARGQGRAEAMRETQLSLKRVEATSHPYFWAGFIVSGNEAPLGAADRPTPSGVPKVSPGARGCQCGLAEKPGQAGGEGLVLGLVAALAVWRRRSRRRQPSDDP